MKNEFSVAIVIQNKIGKVKLMTDLEKYYNKFNEEKRLNSRHGQIEYITSMKYIHEYILGKESKILDVGAGTGRYSVELANEGYDVTAVELVKYNLGILKSKNSTVKAYQGTALNLSRFQDNTFDVTLFNQVFTNTRFGIATEQHTVGKNDRAFTRAF